MKTTIKKIMYVFMAFILTFSVACSPEDGAIGPQGPAGADGINGTDGTNGTDGNANVQTFIFDTSTETGTFISLSVSAITQDVLDNDVILAYTRNGSFYYNVPGAVNGASFIVRSYAQVGFYYLIFYDWSGASHSISAGNIDEVKLIIIESTSTTTARSTTSKRQVVINELAQAGIDINDYSAVCDYYGIAH